MKKIQVFIFSLILLFSLASCGASSTSSTESTSTQSSTTKAAESSISEEEATETTSTEEAGIVEESQANSPAEKDENKWDGIWTDGETAVEIAYYGEDSIDVYIDDIEVHTSPDTIVAEGDTITCTYLITHGMYPPDMDTTNVPEQEWTFVLTHDGGGISYARTVVLTWFNRNEDGTYGHTVTKDHSAYLTK